MSWTGNLDCGNILNLTPKNTVLGHIRFVLGRVPALFHVQREQTSPSILVLHFFCNKIFFSEIIIKAVLWCLFSVFLVLCCLMCLMKICLS